MDGKRRSSAPRRMSDLPTSKPLHAKTVLVPRLKQLVANGDLENALVLAEALLNVEPDADVEAIAESCRTELERRYVARFGRLSDVPYLKLPPSRWLELELDARECFLLAHVDDVSSFEMIVDVSALPAHEALKILAALVERGIIGVR